MGRSNKSVIYYAPKREKIWRLVQNLCEQFATEENMRTAPEEIRRELADFIQIVVEIGVAQANQTVDQLLDSSEGQE